MTRRTTTLTATAGSLVLALALAGCGAGSKTAANTATKVACDVPQPDKDLTVNVLAYNSSAIDPFTNTMVTSCTKGKVTLKHEPIDFGGQVQKTTATLAGETGTYDVVETYGFVIPQLAQEGKIQALDQLFSQFSDEYKLDQISEPMREAMSYEGKLYALPMQAQMYVMAYRKDVFDKLGLKAPTTFEELATAAKAIQADGKIKHPVALPWLASGDIVTSFDATLGSLGMPLTNPDDKTANFDKPETIEALKAMLALKPFMDPEVTTFDQPAVQQQMYNGSAAIAIMFSGRMNDLTQTANTKFAPNFAFAAPPVVKDGDLLYNALSVDGWSLPTNAVADKSTLFEMISSSVSEEASKAALPAAYPAREGMVTEGSSPYAAAANESIAKAPPAEPHAWTAKVSNAITPIIASVVLGKLTPEAGAAQMQAAADKVLSEYK
ncbi:ABC transporter substrate-binding protein [Knoellia sp. CPCC 206453]|uniref:ABC transporter substrate-binding protein n=1 Tax=Knoellia pratensis TaxID=3404796 RepID=UPI00361ECE35